MNPVAENLISQGIWETLRYGWSRLRRWRYVRILGSDVIRAGGPHVAVGALYPPQVTDSGQPMPFIFQKPGVGAAFSTSVVIGGCELRAASYLAESIALNAGGWASVVIDDDIRARADLSFISIGLMNNLKTRDLLSHPGNQFVTYADSCFRSKSSGRTLAINSPQEDHGLILKILPEAHPGRTWICCGGVGEWGTSGAAWYLARRWRILHSKYGKGPFAAIVRVTPGEDESAELVVSGASPEAIETFARG